MNHKNPLLNVEIPYKSFDLQVSTCAVSFASLTSVLIARVPFSFKNVYFHVVISLNCNTAGAV